MRLLLDTHTLIWRVEGSSQLSDRAQAALGDMAHDVFVSAATGWEITTEYRLGKLPGVARYVCHLAALVADEGFSALEITFAHASRAGSLAERHGDPFDRILVAQALTEDLLIVSRDEDLDGLGARRLW